ncbi:scavenger receptor class B member 1 isoform X3 [Ochotona curzoniae]|uniref:scavenger receptor class B member 1 isoform X3 n=1 Tax=Ochotona curzoniae TaxID=130825 RepID=UPI001B34CD7E|nr:scavenger receptor class B member 1 isoform X3 [Ochotona curzoniae]
MMPTLMLGPCMREGPQRPEVPEGLRRLAWSCEAGAWASLRVLPPQNVRIDPSSLSFNMWKEIPVPFYLSIYFFEVTNPEEVLNGGKPQVRERGPYVYREFRHKENITFNDNDTVSFLEARSFQFQPDKSQGSESDYIVMPNILALSTAVMMEDKPMALKLLVTVMLSSLGQRAFMNRTVGEIMWGYQDPFVNFVSKYFPNMFPEKGKFGLFAGMNNSNSGVFTVFTGVKDFSRIHLVDKWNGLSQVNFWHSNQCNMINGTSGQMWPPFMTPESALEFYSPDACRSLKLVYQEPGVFEGIPTYRFVAPKTLFANGSVYPPNEGFCPCLESGIQNVSSCRFSHRDPHELLREVAAEPVHEGHQGHRTNWKHRARGAAPAVVWGERSHGGRDAQYFLHPAGADAQGAAVRTVRPPRAGLRPAARRGAVPSPQPGEVLFILE